MEGTLESHSLLTVGPSGKVQANIKAREVVIFGSVRGNVEVMGKIAIREEGSLVGDIKAAGISIDDGAYFKGSIDIVRPGTQGNAAEGPCGTTRRSRRRRYRPACRQRRGPMVIRNAAPRWG